MEILEEKIIDARMIELKEGRYLRINIPFSPGLFSWFAPQSSGAFPDFHFVWLGPQSPVMELEYQELKRGLE